MKKKTILILSVVVVILIAAGAYVGFDPKEHRSFEDVLAVADALMYQKKQQMKKEQNTL